jgi:tetratricopeptide (TPR) repeat protein
LPPQTYLTQCKQSLKAYKEAIEINPNKYGAYNNMGLAYTGLDKFKEAIKAYKKAIKGFFISLNCLLKLAFMIILITF